MGLCYIFEQKESKKGLGVFCQIYSVSKFLLHHRIDPKYIVVHTMYTVQRSYKHPFFTRERVLVSYPCAQTGIILSVFTLLNGSDPLCQYKALLYACSQPNTRRITVMHYLPHRSSWHKFCVQTTPLKLNRRSLSDPDFLSIHCCFSFTL